MDMLVDPGDNGNCRKMVSRENDFRGWDSWIQLPFHQQCWQLLSSNLSLAHLPSWASSETIILQNCNRLRQTTTLIQKSKKQEWRKVGRASQKVFCKFFGKGDGLMKGSLKNTQSSQQRMTTAKCWRVPRIGVWSVSWQAALILRRKTSGGEWFWQRQPQRHHQPTMPSDALTETP